MNTNNRIGFAKFYTGTKGAVHFLFHFRVTTLYSIKVKLGYILSLNHAGGCTTANSNSVGGPADFYYEHSFFRIAFFNMSEIHLTNTSGEHDRFYPFISLSGMQPHSKRSCISLYNGLSKFVAIIRCPIAGLNLYF